MISGGNSFVLTKMGARVGTETLHMPKKWVVKVDICL